MSTTDTAPEGGAQGAAVSAPSLPRGLARRGLPPPRSGRSGRVARARRARGARHRWAGRGPAGPRLPAPARAHPRPGASASWRSFLVDPVVDEARVTAPGDAGDGRRRETRPRGPQARRDGSRGADAPGRARRLALGEHDALVGSVPRVGDQRRRRTPPPARWTRPCAPRWPTRSSRTSRAPVRACTTARRRRGLATAGSRSRSSRPTTTSSMRISSEGALSLNLTEMRAIQEHYAAEAREPSLAELETIAQTWSEHCQHKTFRGLIEMDGETIDNLLKSTIAKATFDLDATGASASSTTTRASSSSSPTSTPTAAAGASPSRWRPTTTPARSTPTAAPAPGSAA